MEKMKKMISAELPRCMGTCLHWEQVFYIDDYDDEYEKCYDYCHVKKHGIKDKDCANCNSWESGWN